MSEYSFLASTAALVTVLSLMITFATVFALVVMSVIDGFRENSSYDTDHVRDLKTRRPMRAVPQPA
jgi:hypothetical protein